MQRPNIFALQTSNLNTFLFAKVGTEGNGTDLTILSVLARLGKDPWKEAEAWAKLPTAVRIDMLATIIGGMDLSQHSDQNARATASQLVQLLPKQKLLGAKLASRPHKRKADGKRERRWVLICLVIYILLMGTALGITISFNHQDRALSPYIGSYPAWSK